jgi:putative ABC transport system permease protein
MRILLIAGRTFNRHDIRGGPLVVVINEALARRYWGAANPLSSRIIMTFSEKPFEIAGIVGDTPVRDVRAESTGVLYFCFEQFANPLMTIAIRSGRDPSDVAAIVRGAVREQDKELPLDRVSTMSVIVSESLWLARFLAVLLASLAGIAVVLATVGIYGLVRYWTTRRTHEIGIRMALGARPGKVLRMVIGHGTRLAVIGVVLGIPAAAVMTQALDAALYGVSATDLKTFVSVAALLVAIAAVASYYPARRAVRSDPLMALREE